MLTLYLQKHDGISELLEKIKKYPGDTIFHLNTWTFGYEDVWVALAAAFDSKVSISQNPTFPWYHLTDK